MQTPQNFQVIRASLVWENVNTVRCQQCRLQFPVLHKTNCRGLTPLTIVAELAVLFFANFTLIALLIQLTKLSVCQSTYRTKAGRSTKRKLRSLCNIAALAQLQQRILHRHSSGRTEGRHDNLTDMFR
jgi:hypothetical protein